MEDWTKIEIFLDLNSNPEVMFGWSHHVRRSSWMNLLNKHFHPIIFIVILRGLCTSSIYAFLNMFGESAGNNMVREHVCHFYPAGTCSSNVLGAKWRPYAAPSNKIVQFIWSFFSGLYFGLAKVDDSIPSLSPLLTDFLCISYIAYNYTVVAFL